jgi:hypothetical protein
MSDLHVILAGNRMRENFSSAGFTLPKNFTDLGGGLSVIEACVLQVSSQSSHIVCVLPKEDMLHASFSRTKDKLRDLGLNVGFIPIPETSSAVQSALWAADWMDRNPVKIVPGDVLIGNYNSYSAAWTAPNYLVTTRGFEERWGFVEVQGGELVSFKAKSAISDTIATGFYRFSNGEEFLSAAFDCLMAWRERGPLQIGHIAELVSFEEAFSVYEIPDHDFKPLASAGDVRRFRTSSSAKT